MSSEQYRVPVDQLEGESRVARQDQVVLVGDGLDRTPTAAVGPPADGADGDSD